MQLRLAVSDSKTEVGWTLGGVPESKTSLYDLSWRQIFLEDQEAAEKRDTVLVSAHKLLILVLQH